MKQEPQKQLIDLSLPREKPLTFGDVKINDFFIDDIGRLSQRYNGDQYNILTDSPSYYLVGTEGKSTCYIDAVKKKMYSSSSSNEEGMDLPKNVYDKSVDFLENFATL